MIYFNGVTKVYPKSTNAALEDVTLAINSGEFVSIVGQSGAGKTTLTKLILGEEEPSEGTVFFESQDVNRIKARDLTRLRRRIGTVFQDFKLLSTKTAYENNSLCYGSSWKD